MVNKKKQIEFKYILYSNILYGDKNNIKNTNNFINIYKNLETLYLTDVFRIVSFWNLIKKLPIDSIRFLTKNIKFKKILNNHLNSNLIYMLRDLLIINKNRVNFLEIINNKFKSYKLNYNIKYFKNLNQKKKY